MSGYAPSSRVEVPLKSRRRLLQTTDALSLLCVATLTPRKGHAVLVQALAGLRDRPWVLHCAGSRARDPAEAARVDALAAQSGQNTAATSQFLPPLMPNAL